MPCQITTQVEMQLPHRKALKRQIEQFKKNPFLVSFSWILFSQWAFYNWQWLADHSGTHYSSHREEPASLLL